MTLSPAVQAVMDASMVSTGSPAPQRHRESIAAALRTTVEQVLPHEDTSQRRLGPIDRTYQESLRDQRMFLRDQLLAIATELENVS